MRRKKISLGKIQFVLCVASLWDRFECIEWTWTYCCQCLYYRNILFTLNARFHGQIQRNVKNNYIKKTKTIIFVLDAEKHRIVDSLRLLHVVLCCFLHGFNVTRVHISRSVYSLKRICKIYVLRNQHMLSFPISDVRLNFFLLRVGCCSLRNIQSNPISSVYRFNATYELKLSYITMIGTYR